jgi:hypothetical protein
MTKILIAEDNVTNRKLFREVLEARGYTVAEACDGPEARLNSRSPTYCYLISACRYLMALPWCAQSGRIPAWRLCPCSQLQHMPCRETGNASCLRASMAISRSRSMQNCWQRNSNVF